MREENILLQEYANKFEILSQHLGLDYFPVDFEIVPDNFMTEVAVYGLPVRMPHWSYGLRYIHQLIKQGMGNSKIFEVMFPGNPCHAYLLKNNSIAENTLVIAHVIGHADFAKNNHFFANFMGMSGGQILDRAATHAHNIETVVDKYGQERVESVLDAAISLEPYIDINFNFHRLNSDLSEIYNLNNNKLQFLINKNFTSSKDAMKSIGSNEKEKFFLKQPEYDLLWLIANHAPDLEEWERDIFLAVREESFYFYPVFACQIMNEGWASYWHARLLRDADFIPDDLYISAIRAHSDVVRPFSNIDQISLTVNPYHLGFSIWEDIINRLGMMEARKICAEEDDFGFIRNHLTTQLAEKLDLFVYETENDKNIKVSKKNITLLRDSILSPKFNYGAPRISATKIDIDGSLELLHDYQCDGRGLDLDEAEKVLGYISNIWKRPVNLKTIDFVGNEKILTVSTK